MNRQNISYCKNRKMRRIHSDDNPMLEVITDEKFKKKGTGSTALRLRKRDCHKRKLL